MIQVSKAFKEAMQQPVKELKGYLKIDADNYIRSEDDLINIKVSGEGGIGKTAMRKLEAKYSGEHNLLGLELNVGFGVKLADGTYEFIDYGKFLIVEETTSKDTGSTTIVGYDAMIKTMVSYIPYTQYPTTLYDYTVAICEHCGLKLGNDTFVHANWSIPYDLYGTIDGITYRDIFVEIAKATASICIIGMDDKVYFKYIEDTKETLTYANLFKLKLEQEYGEINSVVLSRTPQEDNIYMSDEDSIIENGLTEFKIENNQIIDKDRDKAMTSIFNALRGIRYYPFEVDTEGLGWYEIGDRFDIENKTGLAFSSVMFEFSILVDGGIKERLATKEPTKTLTQYQFATTINKRIKMAEIEVDKQNITIKSLVKDMYDVDGKINENFTQIWQDITNIVSSVQNSGGTNLLKNSVMFAYDNDKKPLEWDISGNGTLDILSSAEALSAGSISGNIFILNNRIAKQRVAVKPDNPNIPLDQKTFYTFSTKIKKLPVGSCYVKISNTNEEYIIELNEGESSFYSEYEIRALLPSVNYYDVEFYGSLDSNTTFTDNMFTIGTDKKQWSQANGEIMNTQVNINLNGVLVKSSVFLGDYTVMSPLEFAGYSMINGVSTKVFSLNKDTTEMKKVKITDEVAMPPIKVIPITKGNTVGWAFVPFT